MYKHNLNGYNIHKHSYITYIQSCFRHEGVRRGGGERGRRSGDAGGGERSGGAGGGELGGDPRQVPARCGLRAAPRRATRRARCAGAGLGEVTDR